MGNSRDREFMRWGVHEMGSLREGVYEMESDVEFSRCEIHEIGS